MGIPMSFSRKAALALTGIAAMAMPLAVAGSASASTTLGGCTVTPLAPVLDHTNKSGQKVIRYQTRVYCNAGRSIQIQDDLLEQDLASSDYYGTAVYDISFDSAATVYRSVLRVLPDADGLGDDTEEMYHAARFQVTTDAGLVSPWTAWEDSPVVAFQL
jgi:hypothetical protein